MVSANNVDQELGWCREEFKKIGIEYAYFSGDGTDTITEANEYLQAADLTMRILRAVDGG
ncbi:MAG: hypothetical protein LUQ64_01595 [Methanomicrobiales archaeon]|nr:hypothetical protein [Methanomicrobiales archaeon]